MTGVQTCALPICSGARCVVCAMVTGLCGAAATEWEWVPGVRGEREGEESDGEVASSSLSGWLKGDRARGPRSRPREGLREELVAYQDWRDENTREEVQRERIKLERESGRGSGRGNMENEGWNGVKASFIHKVPGCHSEHYLGKKVRGE